ncbi:MAG: lactate utilization protein [Thermoguttaceae bacterium]|nr:lactate utilization protein [Thermoguttaceae bacterium]MDW8037062.1 lactate utilization protein [Thermoguttaceae bacterium]
MAGIRDGFDLFEGHYLMDSRRAIFERLRERLAGAASVQPPPPPQVWPIENPPPAKKIERFLAELAEVAGQGYHIGSVEELRQRLAALLAEEGIGRLGCQDRALVRAIFQPTPESQPPSEPTQPPSTAQALDRPDIELLWHHPDPDPKSLDSLGGSVLEADLLLADTGTAMIACPTAYERLLCYLPPVCVVVGRVDRLFEHLPAAWEEIAHRAADPQLRGEFVFITGPSRTADIEKILILGVHGPKRLVVFLVD